MDDWFFDAPGGVKDFREPLHWHAAMAREAEGIIVELAAAALGKEPNEITPKDVEQIRAELAYVDPTQSIPPKDASTVALVPWPAFPRAVERQTWKEFPPVPGDQEGFNRAVEHLGDEDHSAGIFIDRDDNVLHLPVRDRQDEYLEWAAGRDGDGNITSLAFVAEGYDYFSELFERDEGRALDIYKDFTGLSSLKVDDLRAPKGIYRRLKSGQVYQVAQPGGFNPRNRYNINPGIVHLSHRANSLGAEVNLAGVSGIVRKKATGSLVDGSNPEELLCCNAGGNPNRNSDPRISAQAYQQVLAGNHYTLANPVGLYIAEVKENLLELPNGDQVPREWWHAVRGDGLWTDKSRVLRVELKIPGGEKLDGRPLTISDLKAGGEQVQFAGQVARLLSVHLFVTLWKRASESHGPEVACKATCCKLDGTEILVRSGGKCPKGYSSPFPDLIEAGGAQMTAAPALAPTSLATAPPSIRTR